MALHIARRILPSVVRPAAVAQRRWAGHSVENMPVTLSPRMIRRTTQDMLANIDLIVYDMAGTTVAEGGIVYETLHRVMVEGGLEVPAKEFAPWHGAKKEAVIEHFARKAGHSEAELEPLILKISDAFVAAIEESYFSEASPIGPIDIGLMGYFRQLKAAGIKIGLDTGYPQNIQEGLVKKLGFDKVVDGYISSYDVPEGRPYPYMIHRLMERMGIEDVRRVAKVGDSVRDIEEGKNAGCGLVVGVLSGADKAEDFLAAGADVVAEFATDLPVPKRRNVEKGFRLPDLS